MRACLAALGWSQRGLAAYLESDEGRIRKMARDAAPIPPELAEWLRAVSAPIRRAPYPRGWRKKAEKSA